MTLEELKQKLKEVQEQYGGDNEVVHVKADELLLEYIDDDEVKAFYENEDFWCA